jgi:hypothetical protein
VHTAHKAIGPAWTATATAAVLIVALAGCSAGKPSAGKCETVSALMTDIPTRTDQEPKLRIPLPEGWERSTKQDNESVRFAISNPALAADKFTPNAVVTLQKVPISVGKPDMILQAQNDQLTKKLKVTDMQTKSTTVCGATAVTSSYTAPEMKLGPNFPTIPPRKATSLAAIYKSGDSYYVSTLTVQTVKGDNPTYIKDSETIIKGFQMLPPH